MDAEPNPLPDHVEQALQSSAWFSKFKAWGQFLQLLKAECPLTQLCQVRWVTGTDELVIHCPNLEVRQALEHQALWFAQVQGPAHRIIVRFATTPDLVFEGQPPSAPSQPMDP